MNNLYISGSINTLLDFIVVALVSRLIYSLSIQKLTKQPVPLLWRLSTSTRQKTILTGIFLTAGLYVVVTENYRLRLADHHSVCAVSIVRLVIFSQADPTDVTCTGSIAFRAVAITAYYFLIIGNFVGVLIWTAVEPCMGIVGACIPSLRPLIAL